MNRAGLYFWQIKISDSLNDLLDTHFVNDAKYKLIICIPSAVSISGLVLQTFS